MTRLSPGRTASKFASLALSITALSTFQTLPLSAQSFCGPATLIHFNGTNGQYPAAGVTFDSKGNMYGTTTQGGPAFNPIGNNGALNNGLGTIWKFTPAAGLTSIFSFTGDTSPNNNGYRPFTPLSLDGQGNLFGTTYYGGNDFSPNINGHLGWGTIFEYSAAGQFSVLHKFSGPDGANPVGMLLDSTGNLWGATWQGGLNWDTTVGNFGLGTIFKYSGGNVTNPVLFSSTNGGGNIASGLTSDGQGNYYGTTYQGGNGFGTLFQYSSATGQLTTLVNFDRTNGSLPAATVTLDGLGNVYGTTYQGGAHSSPSNACCGTVWKYSLSTGALTTLVSFDGDTVPADGEFPMGGVTLDAQGNLYGTTEYGGAFSDGIAWEYSAAGVLSTLVTFSGPNGSNPEGNLAFDGAGNLYGITNQGGTSGYGTVYKLTPNTSGGTCGGVTVSSLTFNPASVSNGQPSTGTVTLSAPAPAGGSTVGLSSNSTFAIVPSTVSVPAGATSATFTVNTNNGFVLSNTAVTITATLGNSTVQGNMTITPGIAVTSINLKPNNVTAGSSATGTITIASPAPSGGNAVKLSTSINSPCNLPVIFPTNPVTVPAGSTSASFTVSTTSTTTTCTAPIFAQSGGANVSANFTVSPGASTATVSSLALNPASVAGGGSSTGTVTLSASAPSGGTVVALSSSSTSIATVPSSVTVPAGSTSARFSVSTQSVPAATSAVITATLGGSSKQATLTINPPAPATAVSLSALTLNPTTVRGGDPSQSTVTLSGAAPSGGVVVTLATSNSAMATVPASITVPAGQSSATFKVNTGRPASNTSVTVSAVYNGVTKTASLTVAPH
jgi:uncharacterized repeat protein (TIGR03803 family)